MENTVLKETVGSRDQDQVKRSFQLEKSLLEEQLYSSDLKKKLQAANKQIASLKTKVKSLEQQQQQQSPTEGGGGERSLAASLLGVAGEESVLERSRSMNDLDKENEGGDRERQYRLPRLNIPKQQK